jgi:hypothetical protein
MLGFRHNLGLGERVVDGFLVGLRDGFLNGFWLGLADDRNGNFKYSWLGLKSGLLYGLKLGLENRFWLGLVLYLFVGVELGLKEGIVDDFSLG